jgi:hypothetical protein
MPGRVEIDPVTRDFYIRTLRVLDAARVPFLVGGAYGLAVHADIERHTKDLDLFVLPGDRDRILGVLQGAGYRTEVPFPHWLAKAHGAGHFVDVIYNSGNGLSEVDEDWFAHAVPAEVVGVPVRLCPAEEAIWSKSFVMERERFDGADVAHLIRARGESLDWPRLLRRFGPHGRVLLAHLVLFGFIYPAEAGKVPDWVVRELIDRMRLEAGAGIATGPLCRGTLLSREQYLIDVERWGYRDARLRPDGGMTAEEVAIWTAAIEEGGPQGPTNREQRR